jgi:hypothetical protein
MRRTILSGLIAAALLVVLLNLPVLAQGITNLSSLVLSGDLLVGDDATVSGDLTATNLTVDGTVTVPVGTLTLTGDLTLTGTMASADVAVTDDLTVGDDVTVTGVIVAQSNLNVTDDVVVGGLFEAGTVASNGDMQVAGDFTAVDVFITAQSVVTITNGGTITPTGMYQRIASAANTGTSSIANPVAGRMLIVVNVANTTITLTDTGTLKLNGNVALSQYDAVQLLGDGTNWIQIAPVGNN